MEIKDKKRLLVLVPEGVLFLRSNGARPEYHHDLTIGSGFMNSKYFLRPGLVEFLDFCAAHFNLAFWCDGSTFSTIDLLEQLASDYEQRWPIQFVWDDRDHCIPPSNNRYIIDGINRRSHCRDFNALLGLGSHQKDIIIVDSDPRAWEPYDNDPPQNVIYAPGMHTGFGHIVGYQDDTLKPLQALLDNIQRLSDVRAIPETLWDKYCNELEYAT